MFRTIKPDNGYCLFFPKRPEGKRLVIGQDVRVGLWEKWKHIKLGQFGILLPDPNEPELITTAEDLEVQVRADFKVVVGGRPEGREGRLQKATESCSLTRDIKDKIELSFFQDWAKRYCKNSIKRVVRDCSFIRLIEDTDYRAEASKRITDDLKDNLDGIGLILVESTVKIEPLEPKGIIATKEVLDKWLEYRTTVDTAELAKQRATNEAGIAKQKIEDERKKQEEELEYQRKVREAQQVSALRETQRQMDIKERENIRNKEDAIRKFEEELSMWAQEAQLRKLHMDAEIEEEKEKEKEKLEHIRRENAEQDLKHRLELQERESQHRREMEERESQHKQEMERHKLEILEIEREASEKELATMQLKEKAAALKTELERVHGEVRARIIEQETLARSADIIKMREILFQALPEVVREVNRPIEKMGEIRVNFIGAAGNVEQSGFLKGLLTSTSTIPLIKEALRFLRDFEYDSREPRGKETRMNLDEQQSQDHKAG
jgi:hypothetical protein